MIQMPDSPAVDDVFSASGMTWRWDGTKWVAAPSSTFDLNQGEVWGNPDPAVGPAVAADLALMLRAALGDGAAGQAILSGGTGIDPAWGSVGSTKYIVGCYVPGKPVADQTLLVHTVSKAITIPANFAAYAGYASRARGLVPATAGVVINVMRATAAAPGTFSPVGTISVAAGAVAGTFSTSGAAVAYAAGDTVALVAPTTPDAAFAGFSATIVGYET